jgi:6,7-dimethyl-8-ribityllumazine synthase
MATQGHHLSHYDPSILANADGFLIGVAVSEWNNEITQSLEAGALDVFKKAGISIIETKRVPGSFELPLAAQHLFLKYPNLDGVLVIGNVIQGETKHFDFVCQGLTQGVMDVMLKVNKPISFCVLTDLNKQQSLDRSGGIHGNKGTECAVALIQMIKTLK